MKRFTLATTILAALCTSLFATDIAPIYENDLYICSAEADGSTKGVCGGDYLEGVEATMTILQTQSGTLTGGE